MPSSILEKSQEISDKNPNNVEQSTQNELSTVLAEPKNRSDLVEKLEDKFLSLNKGEKTKLKNNYLSQLQKVPFLKLDSFKTKLLSGENFTPQEEIWYSQFYFLAKLSSSEGGEISDAQIVRQIEPVLKKSYLLKYGKTRAVRNKNP